MAVIFVMICYKKMIHYKLWVILMVIYMKGLKKISIDGLPTDKEKNSSQTKDQPKNQKKSSQTKDKPKNQSKNQKNPVQTPVLNNKSTKGNDEQLTIHGIDDGVHVSTGESLTQVVQDDKKSSGQEQRSDTSDNVTFDNIKTNVLINDLVADLIYGDYKLGVSFDNSISKLNKCSKYKVLSDENVAVALDDADNLLDLILAIYDSVDMNIPDSNELFKLIKNTSGSDWDDKMRYVDNPEVKLHRVLENLNNPSIESQSLSKPDVDDATERGNGNEKGSSASNDVKAQDKQGDGKSATPIDNHASAVDAINTVVQQSGSQKPVDTNERDNIILSMISALGTDVNKDSIAQMLSSDTFKNLTSVHNITAEDIAAAIKESNGQLTGGPNPIEKTSIPTEIPTVINGSVIPLNTQRSEDIQYTTFMRSISDTYLVKTVLLLICGIPENSGDYDKRYPIEYKDKFIKMQDAIDTLGTNRVAYQYIQACVKYMLSIKAIQNANLDVAIKLFNSIDVEAVAILSKHIVDSHIENEINKLIVYSFMHAYLSSQNAQITNKLLSDRYSGEISVLACSIADSLYNGFYGFPSSSMPNLCVTVYAKFASLKPNEFDAVKDSYRVYGILSKLVKGGILTPEEGGDASMYAAGELDELDDVIKGMLAGMKFPWNETTVAYIRNECIKYRLMPGDVPQIEMIVNKIIHGPKDRMMKDTITKMYGDGDSPIHGFMPSEYDLTSVSQELKEAYTECFGFPFINLNHSAFKKIAAKYNSNYASHILNKAAQKNPLTKQVASKDAVIAAANAAEKYVMGLIKKGSITRSWIKGDKKKETAVQGTGKGLLQKISDFGERLYFVLFNHIKINHVMKLVRAAKMGDETPVTRKMLKVSVDDAHKYQDNAYLNTPENMKYAYITVTNTDDDNDKTVALSRKYITSFYGVYDFLRGADEYVANGIPEEMFAPKPVSDVTPAEVLAYREDVRRHGGIPETVLLTGNKNDDENALVKSGWNLTNDLVAIHTKVSGLDGLIILPKDISAILFG